MRFLKKKIARANSINNEKIASSNRPYLLKQKFSRKFSKSISSRKRKHFPRTFCHSEGSRSTKNIVKNYGRAICSFATSELALPYLKVFIGKEGIKLKEFISYIRKIKHKIDGLFRFRMILLPKVNDSPMTISLKKIFKEISEVFIKYFSVNWIFHSKIFHKLSHLKFRFKMLRRIQNPELFTYLKNFKDTKESELENSNSYKDGEL